MKSPARNHFMRHQAAAHAAATEDSPSHEGANAYELMLAKLAEDRRRLHAIKSVEQKAKVKAELLPDYAPWIQGVLQSGTGSQDDVLMTVMVWFLDAGLWRGALEIAEYAIPHGLTMPDQYKRDSATVLAEEIAEQAIKLLTAPDTAISVDVGALLQVERLVEAHDMPDEVRAKLHKAIGYALRQNPDVEQKQLAIDHLQRALQLHDKVGVKKDIEVLEREVKNFTPPSTNTGSNMP